MSDILYKALEDAAARMPADIGRAVLSYKEALFKAMEVRAIASLQAKTPHRTGAAAESLGETREAEKWTIGFTDPKVVGLDKGRRRSKPFSRQIKAGAAKRGRHGRLLGAHGTAPYTRMLGSKQPGTTRGQTVATGYSLKKQWPEIQAEAAARVGSEGE